MATVTLMLEGEPASFEARVATWRERLGEAGGVVLARRSLSTSPVAARSSGTISEGHASRGAWVTRAGIGAFVAERVGRLWVP